MSFKANLYFISLFIKIFTGKKKIFQNANLTSSSKVVQSKSLISLKSKNIISFLQGLCTADLYQEKRQIYSLMLNASGRCEFDFYIIKINTNFNYKNNPSILTENKKKKCIDGEIFQSFSKDEVLIYIEKDLQNDFILKIQKYAIDVDLDIKILNLNNSSSWWSSIKSFLVRALFGKKITPGFVEHCIDKVDKHNPLNISYKVIEDDFLVQKIQNAEGLKTKFEVKNKLKLYDKLINEYFYKILEYKVGFFSISFKLSHAESKILMYKNCILEGRDLKGCIPAEFCLQRAISFKKGCYLGQEFTNRSFNLMHLKRNLKYIVFEFYDACKILKEMNQNKIKPSGIKFKLKETKYFSIKSELVFQEFGFKGNSRDLVHCVCLCTDSVREKDILEADCNINFFIKSIKRIII